MMRSMSLSPRQSASDPASPVRMRTAWPMSLTKILPSPIRPVWAAFWIASTAGLALGVVHRDLDLHFRQEVHRVFGAAIDFGLPLLAAESLDLGGGQSLHAEVRQRLADIVQLERLDDCRNQFHLLHPLVGPSVGRI